MENYKNFFDNLTKHVNSAKTRKTLKILEKQGKKYIRNIPESTNSKIKRDCKKEFNRSLKLIKNQYKKVK